MAQQDQERLKVLDQHGIFAYWADLTEYRRLTFMGFGRSFGTRRKVHGVRLVVPLNVACDRSDVRVGRPLTAQRYLGTKYSFREPLRCGGSVYTLRRITHIDAKLFVQPVLDCLAVVTTEPN